MKTGHLIAIFAVALLAALAAAFGTWYLQEEEGASAAEGGAHIAVEESVDLLVGQSTVLSPVLIGEDGSIRSDAVFEFSCADEADAAYLKFDNVQQGKVTAVGYKEEPIAVRIVNQEYGVQTEVQVNIDDVLGEVLSVQCAAGSVHYGEDVVLRADVLPRGCDLSDNLAFAVFTEAGEEIPVGEAFSDITVMRSEGTSYSHVITLRACAVGSGRLELSVSYDGEEGAGADAGLPRADAAPGGAEEAYAGSFDFDISVEDAAIGSALISAADADEDGFAAQSEIAAMRRIAVAAAADFSVLDLFPSVEEVFLPAEAVTHAYGLPASGEVRFYVPSALLSAYLADSVWSAAERNIFPQAAAEEGSVIAVLHSEYGTPLAAVDLSAGQLPVYAHTGYTHTGWSTEEGGDPVDAEEIERSVHLYALWRANTYTVRFVGNDNDGGSMEEQTFTYDVPAALAKNAFTRTGYTFVGWTRFGGDTVYADEQEVLNLTAVDGGTVGLYAVWEANTYTVTFDYGTGTGDTQSMQVTYDKPYGELPEAILAGYIGIWTLDGEDVDEKTVVTTARDHTLTARYKGNELTLTLEYDGKEETRIVTHGEPYGELPAGEGRTGHTLRWYTEKDGGKEVAAETVVNAIESHTLYGRYVANTYTVTFDYNGYAGEGDVLTMQVTYEALYGPLPAGSRTGYVVTWISNVGGVVDAATRVTTPADHTLTAEWSPIEYTVLFADGYTDGGNGEEQSFVYDAEQALKEVQFSREGYTFLGWSREKGADEALYAAEEVVKNLTAEQGGIVRLYAVWKPYTFRVTVYPCTPGTSGAGEGHSATLVRDQLLADTFFAQDEYAVGYSVAGFSTQQNGPMEWALGDPFDYSGEDGAEVTLYAVWRANVYEVHFDGNGNDGGGMGAQSFAYDTQEALTANDFTKTGYTFAGWAFSRSGDIAYQDGAEVLNLTSEEGGIVTLYARWRANSYTVTFDPNGGTGSMPSQSFTYDSSQALRAQAFERVGYTFAGWSRTADGQVEFADGDVISNLSAEPNGIVTLYAVWRANTYTVTFDYGAGSGNIATKQVTFDAPYGTLPTANREGHTVHWMLNDEEITADTKVSTASNHELTATYTVNSYRLTVENNEYTDIEGISTGEVAYGTKLDFEAVLKSNGKNFKINIDGKDYTQPGKYSFIMPAHNVTITASGEKKGGCVATGTLITLADGSQVPVEQLTGDELLLVWNLETGSFDAAPILFIDSEPSMEYEIIRLVFSDGTEVKVIYEHGFWDIDLNRYVYFHTGEDFSGYIGHRFYKQSGTGDEMVQYAVTLTDVVVERAVTEAWSPVTYRHLCFYVDGMLSMPGSTGGLTNIFAVDAKTMRYDEEAMRADIEKYGLFTYEDFAGIISEPVFDAFNGAYLKVAMGKGLLTWEDVLCLVEQYSEFFDTLG